MKKSLRIQRIQPCPRLSFKAGRQEDISTAHRLPTYNKSADDKIIDTFTRRSVRDEFYGKRKTVAGKEVGKVGTLRDLAQDPKKKLYISESLTQARKKLFDSINKFKKVNSWKYIWTNNGRIYLKQGDGDKKTFTFYYEDEFLDFKSKFSAGGVGVIANVFFFCH